MLFKNNILYLSYKALYSYQGITSYLIFRTLDPLFHYIFYSLIGVSILGWNYLQYIIIGNIIFILLSTIVTSTVRFFRFERLYNTLPLIFCAPTRTYEVVLKRMIIPAIDGLFLIIISFFIAHFLVAIPFTWTMLPGLLMHLFSIFFSLSGLALIIGSLSILFRDPNLFYSLCLGVFQILCGVNFPTYLLPNYLIVVSNILPITHGLMGIRKTLEGASINTTLPLFWKEILVGFVFILVGGLIVKMLESLSRKNGSIFFE